MGREQQREFEAHMDRLVSLGKASPKHCRSCGLLLDDPTLIRHPECPPPPVACKLCGKNPIGRAADHYCRPGHREQSECERMQDERAAAGVEAIRQVKR